MKKLITVLILISVSVNLMAQDDIYFQPKKKLVENKKYKEFSNDEKLKYQIDFVKHCMLKYHDQKMTGYGLQLAGILIAGVGLSMEKQSDEVNGIYQNQTGGWTYDTTVPNYGVHKGDNSLKNILTIGGGVISLAGIITLIDSEKWMKRAYIGPDGIGVKFTF